MLFPLFILSIGAVAGGYLFYNLVANNAFWFNSIFTSTEVNYVEEAHHVKKIYKLFPIFLVVLPRCPDSIGNYIRLSKIFINS